MGHDPTSTRRALVDAVRAASLVCRDVQADLRRHESVSKSDASPVTVADLASQALIVRALAATCPGIPVTGEEDASTIEGPERAELRAAVVARLRPAWPGVTESGLLDALGAAGHPGGASGRFFTVDPIDGTKGFLRGEQYAVALALVEDGRVIAGALGCPNLAGPGGRAGIVVHAVHGDGAWVSAVDDANDAGDRLHVSDVADAHRLRLCESAESGHSDHATTAKLRTRLGVAGEPVRMDSQAKYAALALAVGDLYLRVPTDESRREWIWDHAAGVVAVEEAGGRVTDLAGAALDFSRGRRLERNRGICASNGRLHDAILAALA